MPPVFPRTGVRYRIFQFEWIQFNAAVLATPTVGTLYAFARIEYDDGTREIWTFGNNAVTAGTPISANSNKSAKMDGYVSGFIANVTQSATIALGSLFAQATITSDSVTGTSAGANGRQVIAEGYIESYQLLTLGKFQEFGDRATWVFQGTVLEDATAGTHVCSLTVSPGAGNEMEVVSIDMILGATATAQSAVANVDDGTNVIVHLIPGFSYTTSGATLQWPNVSTTAALSLTSPYLVAKGLIVSGTMRLVLKITTTAVSVTQTFAVACRIRGSLPTATLADTVGAPTLTTNTSQVF